MSQRGAADNQNKPGRAAASISGNLRFVENNGRLVLADTGDVAVRLTDDGDGRLVLDDAAASGLTIASTSTRIGAY